MKFFFFLSISTHTHHIDCVIKIHYGKTIKSKAIPTWKEKEHACKGDGG